MLWLSAIVVLNGAIQIGDSFLKKSFIKGNTLVFDMLYKLLHQRIDEGYNEDEAYNYSKCLDILFHAYNTITNTIRVTFSSQELHSKVLDV